MCDFSFQSPRAATTHAPGLQVPPTDCYFEEMAGLALFEVSKLQQGFERG